MQVEELRHKFPKGYRVFRKMLETGHPPDDWHDLLKEAKSTISSLRESCLGFAEKAVGCVP
jgi:hypothetical protein